MPRWDENTSAGWGSTDLKILDIFSVIVAGNSTLIAKANPHGRFRGKYYAVFVNGAYKGNFYCPMYGQWEMIFPLDIGTEASSFYIVEAGNWDSYDIERAIPSGWISEWETSHARRLRISWDSEYFTDGPAGDTQLSSIEVSGAQRGINCSPVPGWVTRAVLTYSINTVGTIHIIRIWDRNNIVAEGSRTGDGLVTCTPVNDSGLTVDALLAYTGDLEQGTAEINLSWPGSYQIHYSTAPLVFPRTPEFVLYDDSTSTSWTYLSPVLSGAVYHYNVVSVSDEGVEQSVITPPYDSPKTIYNLPAGPVITSVTGDANATVINWTEGEVGCSYTIFYSSADQPINMGEWETPVPFTVPTGSTSATLPAITGWETVDQSVYTDLLEAAITSEVDTLNAIWNAGETGFSIGLTTMKSNILAALEVFEESIDWNLQDAKDLFSEQIDFCKTNCDISIGIGLTTTEFKTQTQVFYGELLRWLGEFYNHAPGFWTLPDGTILTEEPPTLEYSLIDIVKPIIHRPTFCALVRATKQSTGLQEAADRMYCWQYDDAGDVMYPAPNQANMETVEISGTDLTIYAEYFPGDEAATPDYIDFYCVDATNDINYEIPATSFELGSDFDGIRRTTIAYSTTSGYKKIAVKARVSSTGMRSLDTVERFIYVNGTAPDGVANLRCEVISGDDV